MSHATDPRPGTGRRARWAGIGLGPRLFAATGLVVVAGAGTLLAVALLVAPQVFQAHLQMALGTVSADTRQHVDDAFTRAVLLSLAMAVAVATLAALTVAWLVSRRIAACSGWWCTAQHAQSPPAREPFGEDLFRRGGRPAGSGSG